MANRRTELIKDLVTEQMENQTEWCSEYIEDAVRSLLSDLLCDLKFDRPLMQEYLTKHGWTDEDFKYFNVQDMFDEEEE